MESEDGRPRLVVEAYGHVISNSLSFEASSMVAVAQDQQQDDQKNDTANNLTKKMWNRYLTSLFEI